jgi:hypothetical protein
MYEISKRNIDFNIGDIVYIKKYEFGVPEIGILLQNRDVAYNSSYYIRLYLESSDKTNIYTRLYSTTVNEIYHLNINTLNKDSELYKRLKKDSVLIKLIES